MQIHELDNYNGELNSGAYVAVDNGSDTGKVSAVTFLQSVNNAITILETFLNGRIDNIIAGGTAPSTAEVTDARYGADGITYVSLGDAIRSQIERLNNCVDMSYPVYDSTDGKFINHAGNIASVAGFSLSDPIPVKKYDEIIFVGTGYQTEVSMISTCNESGTIYHAKVISTDSAQGVFTYTAEEDGFIAVSYNNTKFHRLIQIGQSGNTALNGRLTSIEPLAEWFKNVSNFSEIVNNIIPTEGQAGKYVQANGSISSNSNYHVSDQISLDAGQTIVFRAKGYQDQVAMIARYIDGTKFDPLVVSVDTTIREYSYTAETNMIVVLSSDNRDEWSYSIYSSNVEDPLINGLLDTLSVDVRSLKSIAAVGQDGKFVQVTGTVASVSTFYITEELSLPEGYAIKFNAKGYLDNVAVLARKNADGTYTPLINSVDSAAHKFEFSATETMTVVISSNKDTPVIYSIVGSRVSKNTAEIEKLGNNCSGADLLAAFKNITCIGDSLTYSAVYVNQSTSRQAFVPYPKVLENKTGCISENLGVSGINSLNWWLNHQNEIVAKDAQLAIIYLGTNGGLTDTIDSDCPGDDYTQWADTNTGAYAKIIAKLQSVNSRVLLVKCYAGPSVPTTNIVIGKMATKFNVAVIDPINLTNDLYHLFPDGTGKNSVHLNDFGYTYFADRLITRVMNMSDELKARILPI